MTDEMIKLGTYNQELNKIIGTEMKSLDIYRSKGLPAHLLKRKHYNALKYIDYLPEIISNPDYVGIDPKEPDSVEFVKVYKDNIWVGIKLYKDGDYYYVSTMYDVQEAKISRRLYSGRIKPVSTDKEEVKEPSHEDIDTERDQQYYIDVN